MIQTTAALSYVVPISGKDSLATALVVREMYPDRQFEYFHNATGAELPETNEWLDRVEAYLGQPVVRVGANLVDIIYEEGILPSPNARYCTRLSKIKPMETYLTGKNAIVYFGLRADENRTGYVASPQKGGGVIIPAYPLQAQGIRLNDVYTMLTAIDLLPPTFFWKRLYDAVMQYPMAETEAQYLEVWEFDSLFAWRSRPNCFFCFYQRLYELVGLMEHHSDLFEAMEAIENEVGATGYSWKKDRSLGYIRQHADRIFDRRAKGIAKWLVERSQMSMFDDDEELAMTPSCGLLCGK